MALQAAFAAFGNKIHSNQCTHIIPVNNLLFRMPGKIKWLEFTRVI